MTDYTTYINEQVGDTPRFYMWCTCGWVGPLRRTIERAEEDEKFHVLEGQH